MITWEKSACFCFVLQVYIIGHGKKKDNLHQILILSFEAKEFILTFMERSVFHAEYCSYLVQGRTGPSFFSHILNFLNLFCKSLNLILRLQRSPRNSEIFRNKVCLFRSGFDFDHQLGSLLSCILIDSSWLSWAQGQTRHWPAPLLSVWVTQNCQDSVRCHHSDCTQKGL